VTIKDKADEYYSSVYKVNVNTGEFKKYIPNGKRINGWYVNKKGEVLMAIGVDGNSKTDFSYFYARKDNKSEWALIKKNEAYQSETFSPVLYEPETNSVIIISDHKLAKDALWRYHIASDKYDLLGEAPDMLDVSGAITKLEGDNRVVVGFTYTDHFVKKVYFEGSNSALNQQIYDIFKQNKLQAYLTDWDKNQQRYIVYTVSDNKPGQYYLFDRAKNKLIPWYGEYPALKQHQLSKVLPISFKARDGMALNGYVTLPEGVENPPLVVYPHGGPYGIQDSQYFDPFVQLFASRGYAVLQVNYRGSGGFGNHYLTSGYSQWGKKMQTDIIDGVNWLKKQNRVNTDKACIAGASYGGYAALAAGYQTPDQFKCIVSIAGVSDMNEQVSYWKHRGLRSYINNAVNEKDEDLDIISPIDHVKQFKAPVLLIHGKVDTRVSYLQSEEMYDALKDADKQVEYKLFDHGTHNLDDATNRKQAMVLMIDFIDKYLK
jgi:dipeptidyl aminopeptidase/acylaminoacyl peptidase